jgi:hypothetical protein
MNPLLLAQLGLGAGQSLAGLYQMLNAKPADYSALDRNIAEKERTRNRMLGTFNRASEEGRRGFNPTDLSRMMQGAQNANAVYNANMGGGSLAQRMGGLAQGAQQFTGNVADIGSKNTIKQQENQRYADQLQASLGQAEKNVSDAGLDKMDVMNKVSAAQKRAGWGALGSGLTSMMGGLKTYKEDQDLGKSRDYMTSLYEKMYGSAGGGDTSGTVYGEGGYNLARGEGDPALFGPPNQTDAGVFTPNPTPLIPPAYNPMLPQNQIIPSVNQQYNAQMPYTGVDQNSMYGTGNEQAQPNYTQLQALLSNPRMRGLLQTNPDLLSKLLEQTKSFSNSYDTQVGY